MPSVVKMDVPADVKYMRVVSACVTELLAARARSASESTATDTDDIVLAVQELCMNIVDHAYEGRSDGRISLDFTVADDSFTAEFSDDGVPFDPSMVTAPDLEAGQVRGYGLFMMMELLDDVTYTSSDGRNHWRLTKRVS
jgi:serine/threonine-protein kinase RsbW